MSEGSQSFHSCVLRGASVTALPKALDVQCCVSCLCVHAKSLWSCPTLCSPKDHSPPGSSVHRILQAIREFPFPPLGDLPDAGIKLASPIAPVLADRFTTEPPGKLPVFLRCSMFCS